MSRLTTNDSRLHDTAGTEAETKETVELDAMEAHMADCEAFAARQGASKEGYATHISELDCAFTPAFIQVLELPADSSEYGQHLVRVPEPMDRHFTHKAFRPYCDNGGSWLSTVSLWQGKEGLHLKDFVFASAKGKTQWGIWEITGTADEPFLSPVADLWGNGGPACEFEVHGRVAPYMFSMRSSGELLRL